MLGLGFGLMGKRLSVVALPRNVTADDINTTTESRWFSPIGIAVGSTMTVGTGDYYTLDGTTWLNTSFTWVEGTKLKLRTDSTGTYSTAETPSTADATLLDDGVVVATFTVTSPLEVETFGPTWAEPGTWDDSFVWTE